VGQELEMTPLGLITFGLFVAAGFLWGIRITYRPLLRRHAGSKQTLNKFAAPNGGPATRLGDSGAAEGPPSVS
jgi:hypothetical protein